MSTRKNDEACGEFEGWILPSHKFSSKKSSVAFCSLGVSGNTFPTFGTKDLSSFILWSHALDRCASSSENAETYSLYRSGKFVSVCVLALLVQLLSFFFKYLEQVLVLSS